MIIPGPFCFDNMKYLIFLALFTSTQACNWSSDAVPVADDAELLRMRLRPLTEMSGLAASGRHRDKYWAHNDSGDDPRLIAFDSDGQFLGAVDIGNAKARDWEDMDSFADSQGHWLLVADTGDNRAVRKDVSVYVIPEPAPHRHPPEATVDAEHRYRLRFPAGPRDIEAVAIDAVEGAVYLLTKRTAHPELYRFSLSSRQSKPLTVEYLGEVKSLPAPHQHIAQRNGDITAYSPTAMSFSHDRSRALIVTLKYSYVFDRAAGQNWLNALNQTPRVINPGTMPQIEAGTFSSDSRHVLVGSEGKPPQLAIIPIANEESPPSLSVTPARPD